MRTAHNDCHFTMLGFSLANGRPLLCVIIVACSEIDAKIRMMGLQSWYEVEGEGAVMENLEINSHGTEKYFPFGLTCTIDGEKIPKFMGCSKRGGITTEILMEAMAHIDSSNLFNRGRSNTSSVIGWSWLKV
jgi:hypothetical protein